MKMKHRPLIVMAVLVILAFILSQCGGTSPVVSTVTTSQVPTISAETVSYVETTCGACHSFSRVSERGHSEAEWSSIVDQMIANGLAVSNDQRATIIQYLAQVYP
ncbi:MAG TPA: hypothetical protein VN376_08595 [Longilinea sp.]|nr:hypothetical protein [Longilinea sp.]